MRSARNVTPHWQVATETPFSHWLQSIVRAGLFGQQPPKYAGYCAWRGVVPFDRVGLPAFQFIQDELDYSPRTHHTNLDTYDHLRRDDLMQASVVMAAFLYDAAMRPEPLPRKPLPRERKDEKKDNKDQKDNKDKKADR